VIVVVVVVVEASVLVVEMAKVSVESYRVNGNAKVPVGVEANG